MFWPHHMMGAGWGAWIIGGLVILLVLAGLIAAIFFTIRAYGGASRDRSVRSSSKETALDILKRRYAQGEIDQSEYEAKRRQIES